MQWQSLHESKKYLQAIFVGKFFGLIEDKNVLGAKLAVQTKFFETPILSAEYFVSRSEPEVVKFRGLRFIFWDVPIIEGESFVKKQKGWLQACGPFFQRRPPMAYLDLKDKNKYNYFKDWGRTLKNHRNRWLHDLASRELEIEKVVLEVFHEKYLESSLAPRLRKFYGEQMLSFAAVYKDDCEFFLIKNKEGEVLAGTCILNDRQLGQTVYQYAFSKKEAKYKHVGVGMINMCILQTFEQGNIFLNMTAVYEKGQDKSWKGLTAFKMQFHPKISSYKNTYFKITI
jgi:hypothetical protein